VETGSVEPKVQVNVRVPPAVADALRAEALRRLSTPGQVASDLLARFLPQYIAGELRRDLAPPVEVEARIKGKASELLPRGLDQVVRDVLSKLSVPPDQEESLAGGDGPAA